MSVVRVYRPELAQEVGAPVRAHGPGPRRRAAPRSDAREAVRERERLRRQRMRELQQKQARARAESDAAAEAHMREARRAKEQRFAAALEALDAEDAFVKRMGAFLENSELLEQRKREKLHSEWTRHVYEPIRREVAAKVDAEPAEEMEARLNGAMQEYLDARNRNRGQFRDIVCESEYDPLRHARSRPTYDGRRAARKDPLKRDLARIQAEREAVASMGAGRASSRAGRGGPADRARTRATFDVRQWDRVGSTPHGRYSGEPPAPKHNPGQASSVVLDHYQ